ncbi:hypothetical protein Tco_0020234 [Tanacetum coccineum]
MAAIPRMLIEGWITFVMPKNVDAPHDYGLNAMCLEKETGCCVQQMEWLLCFSEIGQTREDIIPKFRLLTSYTNEYCNYAVKPDDEFFRQYRGIAFLGRVCHWPSPPAYEKAPSPSALEKLSISMAVHLRDMTVAANDNPDMDILTTVYS